MGVFGKNIADLGTWQDELARAISRFEGWADDAGLVDASVSSRLARINQRLCSRNVSIAFVAEFSRGKSELINALFFSEHGQRIVPSSAGRTTMCPTELLWDEGHEPGIRLLPIRTRLQDTPIAEFKLDTSAWQSVPFDPDDAKSLTEAFAEVLMTESVSAEDARELGFGLDEQEELELDDKGNVDVPKWRHALVNLPHPMLKTGLNIIDTPGLNAIGSEPELTLNTIPNADAVLFLLAADAGVTRTDIEVWREHICPSQSSGRFVVLNKIDGLWDELKTEDQINQEIDRQVSTVAETLALDPSRVLPVSAQKGMVARALKDEQLLERSRLSALETALCDDLIPQQRDLISEHVSRDFDEVAKQVGGLLSAKRRNSAEQLFELRGLRGKNRDVMSHMAGRIRMEREEFDQSLRQLQGLRSVFSRHSAALYSVSGTDRLKRHVRSSRELMKSSTLSLGLRGGMNHLFEKVYEDMDEAEGIVQEICTMMSAMYRSFSAEHGLNLGSPVLFSIDRFRREINRIEEIQKRQFGTATLAMTEKWALMRRFFESVAVRIKEVYQSVNREIQGWLRAVMSPIEGQIREHQGQLKKRMESVKQVLEANDSLEERIEQLESASEDAESEFNNYESVAEPVKSLLGLSTSLSPEKQAEPEPA